MQEYLRGTRRSAVVFNTPSVCQCHGWKLAEYLAMGKATVSPLLSNIMSGEFMDGIHYLCCDSVECLEQLKGDEAKRESLKRNAKHILKNTYLLVL